MNKSRIINPNNKEVRDCLSACRLQSKKSRTTENETPDGKVGNAKTKSLDEIEIIN